MMRNVYPVFEKDGEEYVADTRSTLTSNPPKYNAYRLKDRKQRFVFCSEVHGGKKVMYDSDFRDFMYGKFDGTLTVHNDGPATFGGYGFIAASPTPVSTEILTPITHIREKTTHERVEDLEKKVEDLIELVKEISLKL